MILLDSRFCGYDLGVIGFPSVETCMAVVLETKDWLVGWHAMNTGTQSLMNDAAAFGNYAGRMGNSASVRLYGVTHSSRSGTMQQLKAQMRGIAGRMNYNGRISCFFMPERRTPQQDYVQFTRVGGNAKCAVEYIDQNNVSHGTKDVEPSKTRHLQIFGGGVNPLTTTTTSDMGGMAAGTTTPIRTDVNLNANPTTTIAARDWTNFRA